MANSFSSGSSLGLSLKNKNRKILLDHTYYLPNSFFLLYDQLNYNFSLYF